jgi:prepilin-type N-terminal cleavage/methylation domain-containing protein
VPSLRHARKHHEGFTLAELLIALLILGEIATFTIPKILISQQNTQRNAVMKETAGMLSAALSQAKLNGTLTSSSRLTDLAPYFNYLGTDTSSLIDNHVGYTSLTCSGGNPCYRLHSGAMLTERCSFAGSSTTDVLVLNLDTDTNYSGSTTGIGKSVQLELYYNGRITSRSQLSASVNSGCGVYTVNATADPEWVSW